MELLIVRHGIAEDRDEFARTGQDDSLRPLTDEGRKKMREVAAGLHSIVPALDLLASSPFTRAMQTAELVADAYDGHAIEQVAALEPERKPTELQRWLREHGDASTIAVVGHEPHLGLLVSWLICGRNESCVDLKKGGACLLAADGAPRAGSARLLWSLTPKQLRALGE